MLLTFGNISFARDIKLLISYCLSFTKKEIEILNLLWKNGKGNRTGLKVKIFALSTLNKDLLSN